MYKIVAAVNSMIEKNSLIGQITQYEIGYYFVYNEKFVWSIGKSDGYYLVFYPKFNTIQEVLADHNRLDNSIAYNTDDMKAKEVAESFAELYQVVKSKYHGIDKILDEIINSVS